MKPQSMTGYGSGISENFKAEMRSSNHKNLDIHINMPYYLYSFDPAIRKKVKEYMNRGRIDIYIPKVESENIKLKVNKTLAKEYYNALASLKTELSIADEISINVLASQRDIFMIDDPDVNEADFFSVIDSALEELRRTRTEEGANLIDDISERMQLLAKSIEQIEQRREGFIASAQKNLQQKLQEILGSIAIDEARIIQETAILVEKSDITEEIVRINSHLKHFNDVLRSGDTVGKKLDFIIQELRREVNTISSKTHEIDIAGNVVEMRHELEKIKEQIQNLQ